LLIIDNYHPMKVAVRFPEGNARGTNKDSAKGRYRVEGVVIVATSSRNAELVTGALNTFKKHSGSKPEQQKRQRRRAGAVVRDEGILPLFMVMALSRLVHPTTSENRYCANIYPTRIFNCSGWE
jgi:hypothetical protein